MLSSLNLKKNSFIRSFINKSYCNAKSSSNKQISEEEALEQYERSKQGKVFMSLIPQLVNDQHSYQVKMSEYNNSSQTDRAKRESLLKEIFGSIGENCSVETPINSNWGCKHVHLGNNIYINSNVTFVDDNHIFIGDNSLIAPNVVFCTAGHPIWPPLRLKLYQYNYPIHVGKNVWIGSGAQIMPGVTIGDNSVIGAGSVVTKDIPANCVAMGVPCKVIREIGEKDKKYFYKNNELDVWE